MLVILQVMTTSGLMSSRRTPLSLKDCSTARRKDSRPAPGAPYTGFKDTVGNLGAGGAALGASGAEAGTAGP